MVVIPRAVAGLVVVLLGVSACSSTSEPPDTTSSEPPAVELLTVTSTTSVSTTETTTTLAPLVAITPPEYQIVQRSPTENGGDEVVVLLDPSSYESLTDLDLYDLIAEVVELFPPIAVVHVVDDLVAANTVGDPEATAADVAAIDRHYLARLSDGIRVTYLGPFAASGTAVLGS